MANPPIVIGTFDNVPAPGSPIASAWAQEVSTFVHNNSVQLYATVADFKADSLARVGLLGAGVVGADRVLAVKQGSTVTVTAALAINAATSDGFGIVGVTLAQLGVASVLQAVASCSWSTTNDTPAIAQARINSPGVQIRFHKISAAGAITAAASVSCSGWLFYRGTV